MISSLTIGSSDSLDSFFDSTLTPFCFVLASLFFEAAVRVLAVDTLKLRCLIWPPGFVYIFTNEFPLIFVLDDTLSEFDEALEHVKLPMISL